jgi:large subunit ribosomal protein L9
VKVILTSDVKPLGNRGQVVDVKDGYANNYLLRQSLAVVATPGAVKQLEQQQNAKKRKQAEEVANAQDVATQLEETTVRVSAKAAGNGRLFGTVTNASVADAIHEQLGVTIDRHKIEMPASIKALGTYPIEVRLGNNIVAKSAVQVVALK